MTCPNCKHTTIIEARDNEIMEAQAGNERIELKARLWYAWCPECKQEATTEWMNQANQQILSKAYHEHQSQHSVQASTMP